jgi:hypothetical protein
MKITCILPLHLKAFSNEAMRLTSLLRWRIFAGKVSTAQKLVRWLSGRKRRFAKSL